MGIQEKPQATPAQRPIERREPQAALPQSLPSKQTDSYAAGQQLFEKLEWTLNQKAGSSKISQNAAGGRTFDFKTFKYQDPCTGYHLQKHLFVNEKGVLKEYLSDGKRNSKGQLEGSWVDSKATQYFLVGNLLLDEKGQKLGEVALHPSNNKIEKDQTFIKGSFTFKDNKGQIHCVDANQLCNTGLAGMPAGVVRLGLPPKVELEARYQLNSRRHLIDTNMSQCYQYGVKHSDKESSTFEIKIVPKSDRNKILINNEEVNRLFSNNSPDKIAIKSADGSVEEFYVRKEAKEISLSKVKGGEAVARIRNLTENSVSSNNSYDPQEAVPHYVLERMVSTKTFFWDCFKGDLAVAKGGWVEDKNFRVTTNGSSRSFDPAEIQPTPKTQIPGRRAFTPKIDEEDPFK